MLTNTYWKTISYLLAETDDEEGIREFTAGLGEKVIKWKNGRKG